MTALAVSRTNCNTKDLKKITVLYFVPFLFLIETVDIAMLYYWNPYTGGPKYTKYVCRRGWIDRFKYLVIGPMKKGLVRFSYHTTFLQVLLDNHIGDSLEYKLHHLCVRCASSLHINRFVRSIEA